MNIPNFLSLARLLAAPVIVWCLLTEWHSPAFWLFTLAGVSDGIDGYLAKRYSMHTEIGRFIDPIADKVLLVSIYVTLGYLGNLPVWLVILVVSRDLLIVGGALLSFTMANSVIPNPLFLSKLNTLMQLALVVTVLGEIAFEFAVSTLIILLNFSVAGTTMISGGQYLVNWIRENETEKAP